MHQSFIRMVNQHPRSHPRHCQSPRCRVISRDTAVCKSSTNYVYDFGGKNLIRAVWFSPFDSLPESSGLPWPRDQNQREANAESFLIDTEYGEASTWGYRSGP